MPVSTMMLRLCLVVGPLIAFASCSPITGRQDDWPEDLGQMLDTNPYPGSAVVDQSLPAFGKSIMNLINETYVVNTQARAHRHNSMCNKHNVRIRKEWSTLSTSERHSFISAMHCLHGLRAHTSEKLAPGARSRLDDFVVAHIINTKKIHFSGLLLPWHRNFVWMLETALRNECHYKGTVPYWDWSKHAFEPLAKNPLYGIGNHTVSGNGDWKEHRGNLLNAGGKPPIKVWVPAGKGGGCVSHGPFGKDRWVVNLGPVDKLNDSAAGTPNPRPDGLGHNPRCLTRDFGPDLLRENSNYWNVSKLILSSSDIHEFHKTLGSPARGVHGTGHTFIGGLNNDLFSSPSDPLFFLHHSMVDRVWSMWQSLDFAKRIDGLDGSMTAFNYPASENVTIDDHLYYSPVFQNVSIAEIMDPVGGKYCYMYR